MRKVKNAEVLAMSNAIAEFERLIDKVPFKLNYALSKHRESIKQHVTDFEKARIAICEEYADKDKEGKAIINPDSGYKLNEGNLKVVNDKVMELLNEEVEVPDYQVSVADLPHDFGFSNAEFPNNGIFMQYLCRD